MQLTTLAKRANTPLLHFLSLGLCLLILTAEPAEKSYLFVSKAQQQTLFEQWLNKYGQAPTAAQQKTLLNKEIEDQLLFDQARQRELQNLPVVQARLKQLNKFLATDNQVSSVDQPDLSLEFSDPLIRQYMINAMREILITEALSERKRTQQAIISDTAIADYYQQHRIDFLRPDRYQLNHIYVGGLNSDSLEHAQNLFQRVQQQPDATANLGDAFAEGSQLPMLSAKQLLRKLGGDIANMSPSLQPQQWSQPIASSYGYHLLYLVQKQSGTQLALQQVAKKIQQTLQYQLRDQLLAEQVNQLKNHYQIELESESQPLATTL